MRPDKALQLTWRSAFQSNSDRVWHWTWMLQGTSAAGATQLSARSVRPQGETYVTGPSFNDVAAFVREFTGTRASRAMEDSTRIEADLGVTGDDGTDLLEAAMDRFHVDLASPEKGIARILELGPNEYFFGPEGFDLPGISAFIRRLKGEPRPLYRDLTVGELYAAILEAPSLESDNAA